MAFHAEKGFPAGTFVTFQGFFKKIEAAMTSISEFKKIRNQARTYKSESEHNNAPIHDQRDHATKGTSRMICSLQPIKKRKKIKEKSIQKVGQKISESVLYYFRA